MSNNLQHLTTAEEKLEAFRTEKEPERLREAVLELRAVNPTLEETEPEQAAMRLKGLTAWLKARQLFDYYYDPGFNPADVPPRRILPPDAEEGGSPAEQEAYQQAVAQNRIQQQNYRMQTHLSNIKNLLVQGLEAYITGYYPKNELNRHEVSQAVEQYITNSETRQSLKDLLK